MVNFTVSNSDSVLPPESACSSDGIIAESFEVLPSGNEILTLLE